MWLKSIKESRERQFAFLPLPPCAKQGGFESVEDFAQNASGSFYWFLSPCPPLPQEGGNRQRFRICPKRSQLLLLVLSPLPPFPKKEGIVSVSGKEWRARQYVNKTGVYLRLFSRPDVRSRVVAIQEIFQEAAAYAEAEA